MPDLARVNDDGALELRQLAGNIGAEISGVRLDGDLAPATVRAIRDALLRHKVIFFKAQGHLDDVGHERFASRFGAIHNHPTQPIARGSSHITELDSRRREQANFWHTDMTFQEAPPSMSFLRAVQVPDFGGDTLWASGAAAYDMLDDDTRALADRLWVVHSNLRTDTDYDTSQRAMVSRFTSTIFETRHPLVRVHPETGERSIMLGSYGQKFIGYSGSDSQRLFSMFQDAVTRPENTVRWRWSAGDLAIWDNRCTQHYALYDYGTRTRVMRRVTLSGDIPVAVSGELSKNLIEYSNPLQA